MSWLAAPPLFGLGGAAVDPLSQVSVMRSRTSAGGVRAARGPQNDSPPRHRSAPTAGDLHSPATDAAPAVTLALLVLAVLIVANVVAAVPALLSASTRPAAVLRAE